jgi:predicted nuclease with RNAse H fold
VLTVGVDLAAEPAGTAVAYVEWAAAGATLRELVLPAGDEDVLDAVARAGKAGVDCPLGWPDAFVSFVDAHRRGAVSVPEGVAGRDWRRGLANRLTDLAARELTGLVPMSVAADRIGHPAMRCAGLLARLVERGTPVDRAGGGVVVEVYPAASLKRWGLPYRGYKRGRDVAALGAVVDALLRAAPWLDLDVHEGRCRLSDHAFDAVVAALTARAAALGLTAGPDERQAAAARTEGWIAVPTAPIGDLPYGL